jgi:hypothetical protein
MKERIAIFARRLLLASLFCYGMSCSIGQGLDLITGASVPEGLFAGIRLTDKQVQTGFTVGTLPIASGNRFFSVSGEVLYHFLPESKDASKLRPLYLRSGVTYVRDEDKYRTLKNVYFNTRVGKEISFSEKAGLGIDGGLMVRLSHREIIKQKHSGLGLDFNFLEGLDFLKYVSPVVGVTLFYRMQ